MLIRDLEADGGMNKQFLANTRVRYSNDVMAELLAIIFANLR